MVVRRRDCRLRKETISRFLNIYVKIIQADGFVLYGTIDEIYDDALLFTTKQTSALISLDYIKGIVPVNEEDRR